MTLSEQDYRDLISRRLSALEYGIRDSGEVEPPDFVLLKTWNREISELLDKYETSLGPA